ncbi:MAG: AsmA family protein [Deltaproteobacteria bacterium]|nr:AsmA family protein [Deltaproteobacteria bacterium]MBW2661250.1 AsmA family protein [Deltaproteobacteria bacterium]
MKKWILLGGGALIAVIIIVLVIGLSNLGPIIKSAVNTYGPEITRTEVKLGDVDISLLSAEAELKDFLLGNPDGFKSPQAMSVNSIHLNVDEKSLIKNTIIIDKIEVVAPEITYEKIRGTDNFQSIMNNVKKTIGADNTTAQPAEKGEKAEGKKILIKNFILRNGKVNLIMSVLGEKTLSADLPDIHLRNVGQDGASPAEAFKEIFAAVYAGITSPAVTDVLNKELKKLTADAQAMTQEAKKQLGDTSQSAKEQVKSTTDKLKGIFGK